MPPLACPLCNAPDFPPIGHYGEGIIPEGTETIDIVGLFRPLQGLYYSLLYDYVYYYVIVYYRLGEVRGVWGFRFGG